MTTNTLINYLLADAIVVTDLSHEINEELALLCRSSKIKFVTAYSGAGADRARCITEYRALVNVYFQAFDLYVPKGDKFLTKIHYQDMNRPNDIPYRVMLKQDGS